ncbi:MAG: hypothetical protein Q7R79_04945 [bacterium]|nr:hypothetical protein [bacterium]
MVNVWRTIFKRPQTTSTPNKLEGLPKLYSEAHEVLYSLSTVFPFVLFPDKIIIRRNHVDLVTGIFFWSGSTTRVQIPDIRQVVLHYDPFFATMEITPQGPLEHVLRVTFLWKSQAIRAKRLIAGLTECHLLKADFSKYSRRELLAYLEEIGKARE